jgi:phage terminase large subunit-like protein
MSTSHSSSTTLLQPSAPRFDADPLNETLEAYPEQEPFLNGTKRYHAFISGIGAGKTNALVQRILINAHYWNPGETGMVVLPTVPSLRNVLVPELRKWNVLNTCEYQPSKNTLVFPNGSRVILESADNDRKIQRLRGPSIAWGGIDEPASVSGSGCVRSAGGTA